MPLDHNHRWKTRVRVILRVGVGIAFVIQGIRTLSQGLQHKRETQIDDSMKKEASLKPTFTVPVPNYVIHWHRAHD